MPLIHHETIRYAGSEDTEKTVAAARTLLESREDVVSLVVCDAHVAISLLVYKHVIETDAFEPEEEQMDAALIRKRPGWWMTTNIGLIVQSLNATFGHS